MKIKASEATGLQLDWGLAVADGCKLELKHGNIFVPFINFDGASLQLFSHAMPRVCMGLIERYKLQVSWAVDGLDRAYAQPKNRISVEWPSGDNLAQAVARCVISMKLGDEFECPDELGVIE